MSFSSPHGSKSWLEENEKSTGEWPDGKSEIRNPKSEILFFSGLGGWNS